MKLYTRSGDQGMTSLIGGRVLKTDARVEAYGELDELNSLIGLAAALANKYEATQDIYNQLIEIMHEVFDCGADLAYAVEGNPFKVHEEMVTRLEQWIDTHTDHTTPLTKFILPGGHELSAQLHVCRTVCRRAERKIVAVLDKHTINQQVLHYINRLSDYFFVCARRANALLEVKDVEYIRSANVFRGKK